MYTCSPKWIYIYIFIGQTWVAQHMLWLRLSVDVMLLGSMGPKVSQPFV